MATNLNTLVEEFKKKEEEARLSNMKREDQITAIYDEIIQRYQPGGMFEQQGMAEIGKRKTQDVGTGTQNLISSGLFGTEAASGIGSNWEATVGAGARLGLQDTMMQRLSGAQTNKAGFLNTIEQSYPDYGPLLAASQAQGQASYGGGGSYSQPQSQDLSYAELKAMYPKAETPTGIVGKDYYTARGLNDPKTQTNAAVAPPTTATILAADRGNKQAQEAVARYTASQQAALPENPASPAATAPQYGPAEKPRYTSPTAQGIMTGDTYTNIQRGMTGATTTPSNETPSSWLPMAGMSKYKSGGVGGSW